jgi:hypothetical protein
MKTLRAGNLLVLVAFVAFVVANLIHNRFTIDVAVLPSALFVGLMLWKPLRTFLIVAAICIVLPALMFFQAGAIIQPTSTVRLLNHVFLLLAGVLGVASGIAGILPTRERSVVAD